MSEIRFFALGGLGENGKNMYVIDASSVFHFRCWLKVSDPGIIWGR